MNHSLRTLCLIAARGGSKRLADKNILSLRNRPLISYPLEAAITSNLFTEIHVSTDSAKICAIARDYGYPPLFQRPSKLATDSATLNDVIRFVICQYKYEGREFDYICLLWPTAVFVSSTDLSQSLQIMTESSAVGVASVSSFNLPFHCGLRLEKNNDLYPVFPHLQAKRSKDVPEFVCYNGGFCWLRVSSYVDYGHWLMPGLKGFYMPPERTSNIDTEHDYKWVRFLNGEHKSS